MWNDYAMARFVSLFSAFVPLKMTNEEHDLYGAGLWYDEIWYFYNFVEMNSSWESRIQHVFSAYAFLSSFFFRNYVIFNIKKVEV